MNVIKKTLAKLMIVLCLTLSLAPATGLNSTTAITAQAAGYSKTTIKAVQQKLLRPVQAAHLAVAKNLLQALQVLPKQPLLRFM